MIVSSGVREVNWIRDIVRWLLMLRMSVGLEIVSRCVVRLGALTAMLRHATPRAFREMILDLIFTQLHRGSKEEGK